MKNSIFKLRSGNSPLFKTMGSSPVKREGTKSKGYVKATPTERVYKHEDLPPESNIVPKNNIKNGEGNGTEMPTKAAKKAGTIGGGGYWATQ